MLFWWCSKRKQYEQNTADTIIEANWSSKMRCKWSRTGLKQKKKNGLNPVFKPFVSGRGRRTRTPKRFRRKLLHAYFGVGVDAREAAKLLAFLTLFGRFSEKTACRWCYGDDVRRSGAVFWPSCPGSKTDTHKTKKREITQRGGRVVLEWCSEMGWAAIISSYLL